jgi:hypothetical protein
MKSWPAGHLLRRGLFDSAELLEASSSLDLGQQWQGVHHTITPVATELVRMEHLTRQPSACQLRARPARREPLVERLFAKAILQRCVILGREFDGFCQVISGCANIRHV